MSLPNDSILQVKDLRTGFDTDAGRVVAVDGVSFDVPRGKTLGIVGESGCGKSVTAFSITRLLPQPHGKILGGSILFESEDLVTLPHDDLRKLRGNDISMIFQEPMTALNPVQSVGRQLTEAIMLHRHVSAQEAVKLCVEMLTKVRIPAAETRLKEYPHQLSGGMRQRVMIAMALINTPKLLIADEPTTALDVTVQAQILELIKDLQRDLGMSVILITHDLGVIAETCDEVVVMYGGRIVERAEVHELFANPRHAYTRGLLDSIPRLDSTPKTKLKAIPGNVPGITDFKAGCRFGERSGRQHTDAMLSVRAPFVEVTPGHWLENCPACAGMEIASQGEPDRIPLSTSPEYDATSPTPSPSALESALHHLRGGADAGAAPRDRADRESARKEQLRSLAEWAKDSGRLIAADSFSQPVAMGAEHRVFYDQERRLALKVTNVGMCGMTFVDGEPSPALPVEYLERWQLQNDLFGDVAELEGVLIAPAGVSLVISQPWIVGGAPSVDEIRELLGIAEFLPTTVPESYYSARLQLALMDCHEGNFVKTPEGLVVPIDVIFVRLDDGLRKLLEVTP